MNRIRRKGRKPDGKEGREKKSGKAPTEEGPVLLSTLGAITL
jgi:hypothetical protein